MAGIIRISFDELASSEGDNLNLSLQKCLDLYATCLITVKSVNLSRSKTKDANLGKKISFAEEQKYQKSRLGLEATKFETKS
jgi:hypothetical protein